MTSPQIQKELAECCAQAVTKVIKKEMSHCLFSILVDESRDISHVKETTTEALKRAVVEVLSAHGLTIAKLWGQGYDGASNMRGEFNGSQDVVLLWKIFLCILAGGLVHTMESFSFILRITNELSFLLQKKDQNIIVYQDLVDQEREGKTISLKIITSNLIIASM
ncbi:hypothetical protein ACJX0J_008856, partial [Zea mays]